MQQIIITYDRRNDSIQFERSYKEAKDESQVSQYPTMQPGILAFYINRQKHLDAISKRQNNEYEGYPSLETSRSQGHCKWYGDFEVSREQNMIDEIHQNQEALSNLKSHKGASQSMNIIQNRDLIANQNSFALQDIISDSESCPSVNSCKRGTKQSGQISFSQDSYNQNVHESNCRRSKQYPKDFQHEPSTFQSGCTSIDVSLTSFTNSDSFCFEDTRPNKSASESFEYENTIKGKSSFGSKKLEFLDQTLVRFFHNSLLLNVTFMQLSNLCFTIDSLTQTLSLDDSKSSQIQEIIRIFSQSTKEMKIKTKQKQKRLKETIQILRELYKIIGQYSSVEIIKRFQVIETRQLKKIDVQKMFESDSEFFEEESYIDLTDSIVTENMKSPKFQRLIEILSLLESLKESNEH